MSLAHDYHKAAKERRERMGMVLKPPVVNIKLVQKEETKEIEPVLEVIKFKRRPPNKRACYHEYHAEKNVIPKITLNQILTEICYEFEYSRIDISSSRKPADLALARQAFCYVAKELTLCSLTQIGKFISRDHTTVLHAIKRAKEQMLADVEYREKINLIIHYLKLSIASEIYWGA